MSACIVNFFYLGYCKLCFSAQMCIIMIEKKISNTATPPWKLSDHLQIIRNSFDNLNSNYNDTILMRDFKVEPEKVRMPNFLNICNLEKLLKQNTLHKIP